MEIASCTADSLADNVGYPKSQLRVNVEYQPSFWVDSVTVADLIHSVSVHMRESRVGDRILAHHPEARSMVFVMLKPKAALSTVRQLVVRFE